jgi:hypothetical protein
MINSLAMPSKSLSFIPYLYGYDFDIFHIYSMQLSSLREATFIAIALPTPIRIFLKYLPTFKLFLTFSVFSHTNQK